MRKIFTTIGLAASITAAAGSAHAAVQYINIIDPLNPTFTQALGINNSGLIVGYGNGVTFNGFQLPKPYKTFTRENFPGATGGTQVIGVDNAGNTVGFYVDSAGSTHGFKNVGGTFTTVDQPGTVFNQLLGVNHGGTMMAGYSSALDPAGATGQMAYSVSGNTFTNINALLPSNFNSQATGVNDSGVLVGFYQNDAAGDFSAFSDIGGTIASFEVPGSLSTQALGINDMGTIVGDYLDSGGMMHGFIDAAGLFTTFDPMGSLGTTINGINDKGQVVGFYVNGSDSTIGFATGVPEPATFTLLGFGLLGLSWKRGRQAGKQQES